MDHDLVLEGRVVRPSGIQEMEVGVSEGRIAELGKYGLKGERRIRAGRSLIFPGFIDIHVHLREPGWEQKEDFRTGTRAAIHGGVTTVADMPNNPVPASTPEALDEKKRLAEAKALVEVKFYGGVSGRKIRDLPRIARQVIGYKVFLAESTGEDAFPPGELKDAFRLVKELNLPVSLHCEDQSVIDRKTAELSGVDRADVHCDIRPPEAEVKSVERVVDSIRNMEGPRANVCHASTGQALRIVSQAQREGVKVQCEAALHHLYFNRRAMFSSSLLKTNPPLRSEDDRRAMVKGLTDGMVSFLVTDHAPHTLDEKRSMGPSGVPGLDDYAHLVSWLIKENSVDPVRILKAACSNPAEYLALDDRGVIEVGKVADFALLDLSSSERVRSDDVMSKCGWSPYEGQEFPGRTRWTVRGGEVLLDDFELVA
jgi:dihydroorotase